MSDAEAKALRLAVMLKHVLPAVFHDIISIASQYSPSSSFNRAIVYAEMRGLHTEKIALAKLARWLAVIRRDGGEQAFRKTVSEILSLLGQPVQQQGHGQEPAQMRVELPGIVPGIYRFGNYDWLGEVIVDKIRDTLKILHGDELPDTLHQLALETFYSMYLLNTELARRIERNETLKRIAELTRQIRENRALRIHTVADELLSIKITADIIHALLDKLGRKNIEEALASQSGCGQCRRQGRQAQSSQQGQQGQSTGQATEEAQKQKQQKLVEQAKKIIEQAVKEAAEKAGRDKNVLSIYGNFVGKAVHKISFTDKIELYKLLSDHPVFAKTIIDAITTKTEERGRHGGTIEFSGYKRMEDYSELPRARITEYAYPETMFLKRLATKDINVRRYEEGEEGKKKKFIVLIDKSGSMGNNGRIEWAKAVAVSLLMYSDDVKVAFFDLQPYPDKPLSLADDPVGVIEKILSVSAGGDTSIDAALKYADEKAPGYTIVLITDGVDTVTYKPRNPLITVIIHGENNSLKKISRKYISIDDVSRAGGRIVSHLVS